MNNTMEFPNTFDEFANEYGFKDSKEIYTNGSELIPVFRVKQWLEHIQNSTQMIDKSNFSKEQYISDTDCAYDCGYNKGFKDGIKSMGDKPSGKWKIIKGVFETFVECSVCGKRSIDQRTYARMDYCPNCGAKMEQ